jgi:hypothetical protein
LDFGYPIRRIDLIEIIIEDHKVRHIGMAKA